MRRFLLSCVCMVSIVAGASADEAPALRSYIYFSKGTVPEGTARMEAGELDSDASSARKSRDRGTTRKASFESVDELGYDYPDPLPAYSSRYAPVYGGATATRLYGTRYGFSYAGRRYASHCYTAPGYESACCESPVYVASPQYRIVCRNPGLIACLFGCHEPRCHMVKVRPPRVHHTVCSARASAAALPAFLLADIERYELPEEGGTTRSAMPQGLAVEDEYDLPPASNTGRKIVPATPVNPAPNKSTAPAPAPLPPSPAPLPMAEDVGEIPELSLPE